jgi:hypothetical protein
MVHACNPSHLGGKGKRFAVFFWPEKNSKTLFKHKKTKAKRVRGCGSSGRILEALSTKPRVENQ